MARDPPSLLSTSSELRDLSLEPSAIRSARITIIHPQLRDLILPLGRGHVLYAGGNSIEEQRWSTQDLDSEDEDAAKRDSTATSTGDSSTTRSLAKLSFQPNCLTARDQIMACGGQHGELYLTNIPSTSDARLHSRYTTSVRKRNPFTLSVTLPTRSINNSLLILPEWPGAWKKQSEGRRIGRKRGEISFEPDDAEPAEENEDEVFMEVDEELEDGFEYPDSPTSSFATYPNTVPFLHAPRIPHLSPTARMFEAGPSTSRRATSFSIPNRPFSSNRQTRQSFSSTGDPRYQPPITYVTSRSPQVQAQPSHTPPLQSKSTKKSRDTRDHPRLLISNNDQTVKMFSLRPARSNSPDHAGRTFWESTVEASPQTQPSRLTRPVQDLQTRLLERMGLNSSMRDAVLPPPRFGSGFGWDGIGVNEGIQADVEEVRRTAREDFERIIGMRVSEDVREGLIAGLRRENVDLSGEGVDKGGVGEKEDMKLAKVGGARFKSAINNSAISPDLRSMVSVGDSTDVYLFEVLDGGREFRRIGVYTAATDAAFSASWSSDGRKFAVASQDGQVTVWDHRSSHPLAKFFTSSTSPSTYSTPSFMSDASTSHMSDYIRMSRAAFPIAYRMDDSRPYMVDPITGDSSSASSTSGREAARVVKFSPEGSSRDLMVFTEENTNIHIVDAKSLNTHVIVPVPATTIPSDADDTLAQRQLRLGYDGGVWGIAGIGFDPTGDWLYSGTERTVVEWDLRKLGGGGGSTWGLA